MVTIEKGRWCSEAPSSGEKFGAGEKTKEGEQRISEAMRPDGCFGREGEEERDATL